MTGFEKNTLITLLMMFENEVSPEAFDMHNISAESMNHIRDIASELRFVIHFMKNEVQS